MRRFLIWGAAGAAGFVALLFAYLAYSAGSLAEDAQAFAEEAVVDVTSDWSTPALMDRASPALQQQVGQALIDDGLDVMARLGKRFRSGPCQGTTTSSLSLRGAQVTASYRCSANFERGQATIIVGLVRENSSWEITSFTVESPALMRLKVRPQAG